METDDSETVDQPLVASKELPPPTVWEPTKICCFRNAYYIPALKTKFIGHWEYSPGFPLTVLFIIISSYFLCSFSIIPRIGSYSFLLFFVLSFFVSLFIISYLKIIKEGPGYFPYYWPNQISGSTRLNDQTSLLRQEEFDPTWIASTQEQLEYAKSQERPNRCIFSKEAKRIVIRPDHFCGWTASWIGKRNHKFFILFNTWGTLYIFMFFILDIFAIAKEVRDEPNPIVSIYLIYAFFGLSFLMLTFSFALSHIFGAAKNTTSWEEWNHISPERFDKGCKKNMEDVCGSSQKWYLWPFPVSPWTGMSNRELIEDYIPYKEL